MSSHGEAQSATTLRHDPIAMARQQWVDHGWGQAADGMAAVTSLMRAHQIALARVETTLKPLGVTFARYEVLMLLFFSRRGSLPMKVIGSRLQVHPTSVTNAVDRLEDAGLVTRSAHPEDRRAVLVALTPSGRRLAEEATAALNAEVFAKPDLSPGDLDQLVDVLTKLRRTAGDFEA
jgi:DNA-binding MarR family transcriptional regulator